MRPDERFAAELASAILKASGEDIEDQLLGQLVQRAGLSGTLGGEIALSLSIARRWGGLGMDMARLVLISVLIEAGKQFWADYIQDKLVASGASATADGAGSIARRLLQGEECRVAWERFAALARDAGAKEGLPQRQLEAVLARQRDGRVASALGAGGG
ncbi:MAG: hypothetical protein V4550_08790 [Gemmatimonadota bacterium]